MERRRRRVGLAIGLAAALILVLFFAMRLSVSLMGWHDPPPEQPVAGWMTPRYVTRSHDVPPEVLGAALGLERGGMGRRVTLAEIAEDRGVALSDLIADVEAAIAADKARRSD